MPKALPAAWSLITDSWASFVKNWNDTFKVSIWFLYFGLVAFAGSLLTKLSGSMFFDIADGILAILVAVGYLWSGIRVIQAVLEIDAGKKPSLDVATSHKAARLILPIIGIGILQLIVIAGGMLLFIIPGIYLAIALSFSQLERIEGGQKGFEALAASRKLVSGRWWGVLWRLFAGNMVFGLAIALLMSLVLGLLATISGADAFMMQGSPAFKTDPLVQGAYGLLQAVMQAALMPLFVIYQVKLYKSLKKTA